MPASASDLATMQAALDKLQAAQLQAQAEVSGSWATSIGTALIGDSSSQDAQNNALTQTEIMTGNLEGPYWLEVQTDQRTVDNWMSIAAQNFATIQSVASDVGNWTFSGVVSSTASATTTQVIADAKTAAIFGTPVILAVVALVLLIEFGPIFAGRSA